MHKEILSNKGGDCHVMCMRGRMQLEHTVHVAVPGMTRLCVSRMNEWTIVVYVGYLVGIWAQSPHAKPNKPWPTEHDSMLRCCLKPSLAVPCRGISEEREYVWLLYKGTSISKLLLFPPLHSCINCVSSKFLEQILNTPYHAYTDGNLCYLLSERLTYRKPLHTNLGGMTKIHTFGSCHFNLAGEMLLCVWKIS